MRWAFSAVLTGRMPLCHWIAIDPGAHSIYTAMREQIGLKLEAGRAPVEMIVIDRIERASEN